jgi:hypothetical protein
MLSTFSITLCGAFGGRLLGETGTSLRGLMGLCLGTAPRHQQPRTVGVLRGEAAISGSERKYDFSHIMFRNILGWLNSDRDNWSGEIRRQPGLI